MGFYNNKKLSNAHNLNDTEVYENHRPFYNIVDYRGETLPRNYQDEYYLPLGNLFFDSIMNQLYKGLSNITLEDTSRDNRVGVLVKYIDSNMSLLLNQYLKYGFIAIRYHFDKSSNTYKYSIPSKNQLTFDKESRKILDKNVTVWYSPIYQTLPFSNIHDTTAPIDLINKIIYSINRMASADLFLTEKLGALGILTGVTLPSDPAKKDKFLKNFTRSYGITQDKYQFILSTHDLKYQNIDAKIDELHLGDKLKDMYKYLANLMGVPLPLLFDESSTYNNVKEARAYFYNTTVRYYAEIFLKVTQDVMTNTVVGVPQSMLTYRLENVPDLEITLSSACNERTALLDYFLKLKEAGIDVEQEIQNLYQESKDLLERV